MESPGTIAPVATVESPPLPMWLRQEVLIPAFVILGYAAFLISGFDGFGAKLGSSRPLPIYIYVVILLFILQYSISHDRSLVKTVYGFGAAAFAAIYAAEIVFYNGTQNFTKSTLTYVILNAFVVGIFVFDAIKRHRARITTEMLMGEVSKPGATVAGPLFDFQALATDFAGASLLFFISSALLDFLDQRVILHILGFPSTPVYADLSLNKLFGWNLGAPIDRLDGLDFALGFVAGALWLLTLAIIAALSVIQRNATTNKTDVTNFFGAIGDIIRRGATEATYSLRSVLEIYIWLVPAFSVANFAAEITTYFNNSAHSQNSGIVDLFNPLSANSLANFGPGVLDIVLAGVAMAAVVAAVAISEFNGAIIQTTLSNIGTFIRIVAISAIFISLSLAFTNAASILFSVTKSTPFQVGAVTVAALIIFVGYAIIENSHQRKQRAVGA